MSKDSGLLVADVVFPGCIISALLAEPMESGRALMGCVIDGSANIASASVLSSLSLKTVRRLVGLVSACVSMFLGDHWKEGGD